MNTIPQQRRAVVVTERALDLLSTPPGLTGAALLLLWHLVRTLPVKGQYLSLTEVARQLGLSRVYVTNAMHGLIRAGFITRGARAGLLHHYQLNAVYFHSL
jgi:DNA-binding MarR family transcriptional regulator